jgi:hypothetical protein
MRRRLACALLLLLLPGCPAAPDLDPDPDTPAGRRKIADMPRRGPEPLLAEERAVLAFLGARRTTDWGIIHRFESIRVTRWGPHELKAAEEEVNVPRANLAFVRARLKGEYLGSRDPFEWDVVFKLVDGEVIAAARNEDGASWRELWRDVNPSVRARGR